jgi:hypothetical protein
MAGVSIAQTKRPSPAQPKTQTLAPGTYHDWHDSLDEVVIPKPINLSGFQQVDVTITPAAGLKLPSETENTHKAVKEVVAAAAKPFVTGLQQKIRKPGVTVRVGRNGKDALLVRAQIVRIDPGSQAARYWGSFSAGAAVVEVSGELVDQRDGSVIARFRQERRSGFGLLGGGYHALLERDLKEIGGDVAELINAL